jgi:ABC-2 type transport system ATP-binding protein
LRSPSGPPALAIEVRGLSKTLRDRRILDSVDLEVPRGTIAVMEGQNGAGKTTFVRVLATAITPDSGTVRINGFDVQTQSLDVRRSIGVSFANERSLYWRINAYQNLELFGKIAGLSKSAITERSNELVEALRLTRVARGQVARMSTGQRQRLMVARALLADPKVILLDEPFRGLDDEGLHAVMDLVLLRVKEGMTALIVAPLIDVVLPIADATFRIDGGVIRPATLGEADDGLTGP